MACKRNVFLIYNEQELYAIAPVYKNIFLLRFSIFHIFNTSGTPKLYRKCLLQRLDLAILISPIT